MTLLKPIIDTDKHAPLDLYSASALMQPSVCRHVGPVVAHNSLHPSQQIRLMLFHNGV